MLQLLTIWFWLTFHTQNLFRMWEQKLKIYDSLIGQCPRFERKGKSMIYTSANGHMFSILNKDAEVGIRFSEAVKNKYIAQFNSDVFKSYGATMRGYVLIPDAILDNVELMTALLNESFDYVMSLPSK